MLFSSYLAVLALSRSGAISFKRRRHIWPSENYAYIRIRLRLPSYNFNIAYFSFKVLFIQEPAPTASPSGESVCLFFTISLSDVDIRFQSNKIKDGVLPSALDLQ